MKVLFGLLVIMAPYMASSMEKTAQQTQKNHCTSCGKICVGVCKEVQDKHRVVFAQIAAMHQAQLAKAYGNPCTDVETFGIESLFTEKEVATILPSATPKKVTKFLTAPELSVPAVETKKPEQRIISLASYSDELTKLIRRGAGETLALLKPESSDADRNNLDVTSRDLEKKNNEFSDIVKAAQDSEKSDTNFLRLCKIVSQAVTSTKKLAEKEPLSTYIADITHPAFSYLNEIELLQATLAKQK